ncbi:unnamed protein product, partial [Dovyalis caffra]
SPYGGRWKMLWVKKLRLSMTQWDLKSTLYMHSSRDMDSIFVVTLVHKAIGDKLCCVFVANELLR